MKKFILKYGELILSLYRILGIDSYLLLGIVFAY